MTAPRRGHPLVCFFVLANLLSWLAWAPLAAAGLGWTTAQPSSYLHLLGGLGPLVAAVATTTAFDGRAGLARLFERTFSVRGRLRWIALAVAAPVILFVVSAGILAVTAQGEVAWGDVGRSVEYPALPRWGFWIANLLFYGLGEEVGWRGFVLPRVPAGRTAMVSALLVGVAWAFWHLPLFAFAGGLSAMGPAAISGWFFSILTGSILMTWLFNSSRGSVLAVALFHGVLDILMTSPVHGPLPMIMGAAITIWGIAVPFIFGLTNLARGPRVQEPPPGVVSPYRP